MFSLAIDGFPGIYTFSEYESARAYLATVEAQMVPDGMSYIDCMPQWAIYEHVNGNLHLVERFSYDD